MDLLKRLRYAINPYVEDYSIERPDKRISLVRDMRSGERAILYNNVTYSRIREDSVFTGSYWDMFIPLGYIYDKPKILMIGLGGGTVPYQFGKLFGDRVSIDAAEIDKDMVEMAKRFCPDMRANVKVIDGFEFLRGKSSEYDAIILDAYKDINIPGNFMGSGFVEVAHRALRENGILAINYAQTLAKQRELSQYAQALAKQFKVYFAGVALGSDNTIIICGKDIDKDEIMKRIREHMPRTKENGHVLANFEKMRPV